MQVKTTTALAAGLFAPAALSFLVAPETAPFDEDALLSILPIEISSSAAAQTLNLPCAGCPVWLADDVVSTTTSNHLELAFSIEDDERLVVNGFELYPDADPFGAPLAAAQVVDLNLRDRRHMMSKGTKSSAEVKIPLGYRIDVNTVPSEDEDQRLELVNVDLDIIEVGSTFVGQVPLVKVQLLKNGKSIAIAKIETAEKEPAEEQPECQDLWCTVKSMLAKVKGGCKGMMGGHRFPHGSKIPMPEMSGAGPYRHRGGHPHGHHGHRGVIAFFHEIGNALKLVVFPIFVGIAAGASLSLLGMIIFTVLLALVRIVRGKKAPVPCLFHRIKADDSTEIIIVEEEKAGLMENQEEHQEPPPKYNDGVATSV